MTTGDSTRQTQRAVSIVWLLAYLLAGPLIWSVQFAIVYALHAAACATASEPAAEGWIPLAMAVVTGACVAAALAVVACRGRLNRAIFGTGQGSRAYDVISLLLIVLATIAILWSGLAMALLQPCSLPQI